MKTYKTRDLLLEDLAETLKNDTNVSYTITDLLGGNCEIRYTIPYGKEVAYLVLTCEQEITQKGEIQFNIKLKDLELPTYKLTEDRDCLDIFNNSIYRAVRIISSILSYQSSYIMGIME